jgi:MoaD family protein
MNIRYFATFRQITGELACTVEEPPPTLREVLEVLSARYGTKFRNAVFAGEELSPLAILLVNGRDVRHTGGLDTPIHAEDQLAVFPVVAGG